MDSLQKVPCLFRFQSCPSWALIRGDMVPLLAELFMNIVATHKKSINIFPVLLITNVRAENDLLPGKGRLEDMTILKELV